MKARIGLAVRTEHPSPPITVGRPELSVATLDDLVIEGPMEERGAIGGPSRWTLLVVGLIAAIAGFGYVGREPDPAPKSVADAPATPMPSMPVATADDGHLRLQVPVEGSVIGGGTMVVRGVADRPLGRIHIAAVAGTTEVGTADVIVTAAGPFAASVSMIEPAWKVAVDLRITAADEHGSTASLMTRAVVVDPHPSIALTRVAARRAGERLVLTIDGVAGTRLRAIELRLLAADGTELAMATPTLGTDEGWGGVLLASRPFRARLKATAMAPGTPLYLVVSWRDPISGDLETATQPMSVPVVSSLPDPMRLARS